MSLKPNVSSLKSGARRARFGVRRLVAAFVGSATCRTARAAFSGSPKFYDAHNLSETVEMYITPLNAVLLGRQVVQAGKAVTSHRTPKCAGRSTTLDLRPQTNAQC